MKLSKGIPKKYRVIMMPLGTDHDLISKISSLGEGYGSAILSDLK